MNLMSVENPTGFPVSGQAGISTKSTKTSTNKPKRGPFVCAYDYVDENGKLLHQTLRYRDPKDFLQRTPTGDTSEPWVWSLKNCPRIVIFNLPKVIASDEVWFVEGEKDALNLEKLGLTATSGPQGSKAWPGHVRKHAIHEPLRGKKVFVITDNDDTGKKHSHNVCRSLLGVAASVKYIALPGLSEKGDVSDFIEKLGPDEAKKRLIELAASALDHTRPRIRRQERRRRTKDQMEGRRRIFEGPCLVSVAIQRAFSRQLQGRHREISLSLPWPHGQRRIIRSL